MNDGNFASFPFYAVALHDEQDFERYVSAMRPVLDDRFDREQALASRLDGFVMRGVNAAIPAPTIFSVSTVGGELLQNGRRLPQWRETMVCAQTGLNNRERALAHFLDSERLLRDGVSIGFIGGPSRFKDWIMARCLNITDGSHQAHAFPSDTADLDLVVSVESLAKNNPYAACSDVARAVRSGGRFIFTTPFYHLQQQTIQDAGPIKLGWDLLKILKKNGFSSSVANIYWSEELGYLGAFNFIFSALRD